MENECIFHIMGYKIVKLLRNKKKEKPVTRLIYQIGICL